MMPKGYISFIFHAHLPYVRHPEHQQSLEEKWYFEALTECYIPMLRVFHEMADENIDYAVTFSLSPTLLAMLEDPFMQERYTAYLAGLQHLARKEEKRTAGDSRFAPLTQMYRERLDYAAYLFNEKYDRKLVNAFKDLQDRGKLELITAAGTHGYLPLLAVQREAAYAQLVTGIDNYRRIFGKTPRGIWLPECAYDPVLEEMLGELGLQYFITATHGVLYASPRPKYGVYSPILTPGGLAAFGRDPETSHQVWSAKEGYPGDYAYREFYRDIGYDLELDYIGEHLHPANLRGNTGFKYYRITGEGNHKEVYDRQHALHKAREHAANFKFNREKQVEYYGGVMDRPPLLVAPYDAELFGHWWFEGPQWVDSLCRMLHGQNHIQMITPGQYLDQGYALQLSTPNISSWGDKGYHEVWLNNKNDWLYRHLHHAAERMTELATAHPQAEGVQKEALTQLARELLLAQSSDWPFIMTAGTMDRYALSRVSKHLERFLMLEQQIRENNIDIPWLRAISASDNLFPHLDYRIYQSMESTVPVEKNYEDWVLAGSR